MRNSGKIYLSLGSDEGKSQDNSRVGEEPVKILTRECRDPGRWILEKGGLPYGEYAYD